MLNNKMTFLSVLSLVIGSQIGFGILTIPGRIAMYGKLGCIAWVLTGIGAISLAMVFAILAQHIVKIGGPHNYVWEVFGKKYAYITAWSYWIGSWLSSVPILIVLVSCINELVNMNALFIVLLEIVILSILAGINFVSMGSAGKAEIIFSVIKLMPLTIVPIICFLYNGWSLDNIAKITTLSDMTSINHASLICVLGFIGLELGTTPASNVENPKVTIPRAVVLGTVIVTIIYLINTFAVLGALPSSVISGSVNPYVLVLSKIVGGNIGKIASLTSIFICLGTLNSWLLASGQIALGASDEGIFPAIFAKKNKQGGAVYSVSITSICLIICAVLLNNKSFFEQLNLVSEFSCAAFLLIYLTCVLCLIKMILSKKIPSKPYMWISITLGSVFCIYCILGTDIKYIIGAISLPISGILFNYIYKIIYKKSFY